MKLPRQSFRGYPILKKNKLDVILLDIDVPDISTIDLRKKINKEFPKIKILGISTFSEGSYISIIIENGIRLHDQKCFCLRNSRRNRNCFKSKLNLLTILNANNNA